jgi:hypothetical protein
VSFFLHETFGGGETWGCQILVWGDGVGLGRGDIPKTRGGVALHHQLLSSKGSRIAKKRKEKNLNYLFKEKNLLKKAYNKKP